MLLYRAQARTLEDFHPDQRAFSWHMAMLTRQSYQGSFDDALGVDLVNRSHFRRARSPTGDSTLSKPVNVLWVLSCVCLGHDDKRILGHIGHSLSISD